MKFEFVLKNERLKKYYRLAIALILINFFAFSYIAFQTGKYEYLIPACLLILSAAASLYFKRFSQRISFQFSFLIISFTWLAMGYFLITGINLFLEVIYLHITRPQVIIFTKENIIYPDILRRKISWSAIDNVVLKDGLLTVDQKSNKILQAEVENEEGMPVIDESTFNKFCREQLQSVISKTH